MTKVIKPMMKTANKMSTERKAKETPMANACFQRKAYIAKPLEMETAKASIESPRAITHNI